ncbi:Transcription factor [Castilleja foliolosa]|uniref:Transcription factor n=1 Tax=Castilleja foliolosa TaxID=1961234 RepID=A0ABD3BXM2_9LAMI
MNHLKALVCILDHLDYDRQSKAVDWLINKAKTAIDELAEIPAWNPTASTLSAAAAAFDPESAHRSLEQENQQQKNMLSGISADSPGKRAMAMLGGTHGHHVLLNGTPLMFDGWPPPYVL